MQELELEIKNLIIDSLDLEDISTDDIDTDEPLFGDGLGLDSIDALELGLALKKKYEIVLDGNSTKSREHFHSVASLVSFVTSQREIKQ